MQLQSPQHVFAFRHALMLGKASASDAAFPTDLRQLQRIGKHQTSATVAGTDTSLLNDRIWRQMALDL